MIELKTSEDLKKQVNYYSLVVGVAKRARKIAEEAESGRQVLTEKPVNMAIDDIAAGKYILVESTND